MAYVLMVLKPSGKFVKTLQGPAPGLLKLLCNADAEDHFENLCDRLTNGANWLLVFKPKCYLFPVVLKCPPLCMS